MFSFHVDLNYITNKTKKLEQKKNASKVSIPKSIHCLGGSQIPILRLFYSHQSGRNVPIHDSDYKKHDVDNEHSLKSA